MAAIWSGRVMHIAVDMAVHNRHPIEDMAVREEGGTYVIRTKSQQHECCQRPYQAYVLPILHLSFMPRTVSKSNASIESAKVHFLFDIRK